MQWWPCWPKTILNFLDVMRILVISIKRFCNVFSCFVSEQGAFHTGSGMVVDGPQLGQIGSFHGAIRDGAVLFMGLF